MCFMKYPSIEGSHHEKYLAYFLDRYPELADVDYYITEKLHGANFQVCFEPDTPWRYGRRKGWLVEGEKFFGVWDVVERYMPLFEEFQAHVDKTGLTIRLFGELYGPGVINKGVIYPERAIRFFDAVLGDELLAPLAFTYLAGSFPTLAKNLVPTVAIVKGLQAALDFDTEFNTVLNPIEDNLCEGVVIAPLLEVYYGKGGGQRFCLKKKNPEFIAKARAPKPPSPGDPEVKRLNQLFRTYIVEERLQSVFSQDGEIEDIRQLGKYIVRVLEDAKIDFLKDHEEELAALDKKGVRRVHNVGGAIANILKKHL